MAGVLSRQGGRLAATLFFCLALAACATGPEWRTLDAGLDQRAVLLDHVPFHSQREFQCGPAALTMVLNAAGVAVTVDDLIPQVYLPAREGSLQPEMLAATRRNGRISYVIEPSLNALLAEVQAGHPVVVLQNLSLPWWPMWHYAVVIGYDLDRGDLILHTGERDAARVGLRRFDNTWARSDRWAMLALAPGSLPARGDPAAFARAVSDFAQADGTDAALSAWRAHTARWPEHALGWFALGNSEYAAGDTSASIVAFTEATMRDPEFGAAWLNLGLALEHAGQIDEAVAALTRSASMSGPWQEVASEELRRLTTARAR